MKQPRQKVPAGPRFVRFCRSDADKITHFSIACRAFRRLSSALVSFAPREALALPLVRGARLRVERQQSAGLFPEALAREAPPF